MGGKIGRSLGVAAVVWSAAALAQKPPHDPTSEIEAGIAALVPTGPVEVRRQDGEWVATVGGAAPAWPELRELGRKAFAVVAAHDPGRTTVLRYRAAGRVARASVIEGTDGVQVAVGDGEIMQDEEARYALAARGKVMVKIRKSELAGMEIQLGIEGRPECTGMARNRGEREVNVTARCVVVAEQRTPLGEPAPSQVLVDATVTLGALAPNAERAFRQKLPKVPEKRDILTGSVIGGLIANVRFQVDGKPVSHLDLERFELATAWLQVLDQLGAEGLTVDTARLPFPLSRGPRLLLRGPDEMAELNAAQRKALGKRLWKVLHGHYKKFKRPWPADGAEIVAGGKIAKLAAGRLSAFRD